MAAVVVAASAALSTQVLDRPDPCAAPRTAPAGELALLPRGLSFDGVGTITDVRKDEAHVTARAVTTRPIEESTVLIQDAVAAAGYRPSGMDSEGFEAEVFFTTGPYAGGRAQVQQAACAGRWDIELVLLDPEPGESS